MCTHGPLTFSWKLEFWVRMNSQVRHGSVMLQTRALRHQDVCTTKVFAKDTTALCTKSSLPAGVSPTQPSGLGASPYPVHQLNLPPTQSKMPPSRIAQQKVMEKC
jgi:hypothetical protein